VTTTTAGGAGTAATTAGAGAGTEGTGAVGAAGAGAGAGIAAAEEVQAGAATAAVTLRRVACATAATLSFSLHPLRAEVVAWCSCQPYNLMTALLVAAAWCHIRRSERIEAAAAAGGLGVVLAFVSALPAALLYLAAVLCKSAAAGALQVENPADP
jgi:hypothetical protein